MQIIKYALETRCPGCSPVHCLRIRGSKKETEAFSKRPRMRRGRWRPTLGVSLLPIHVSEVSRMPPALMFEPRCFVLAGTLVPALFSTLHRDCVIAAKV